VTDLDVSVVVLTWEDFERTTACVKSLPAGVEVVVVDNGSGPAVGDALRELCDLTGARYVPSDTTVSYATGMNLGARYCTRATVVLSNNDVVVDPGAVERLAAAFGDRAVGVAFPAVRTRDGSTGTDAGRFLTLPVGLGHLTGLGKVFPALRVRTAPERADWLSAPFVAVRRAAFVELGGVDEAARAYAEDVRLCWAVRRLGLRVAYVPEAVIVHEDFAAAQQRWTPEEVYRRRTREFIRASRDQGGWGRRMACTAYAYGAALRAVAGRSAARRAMAEGALEGLRAR
jgi:N-acetylglucosaminyl-diphospho-decaprenol L-rhamnosyltransferase